MGGRGPRSLVRIRHRVADEGGDEFRAIASRGKLFGALPAAVGATVRIATSALAPTLPGASAGADAIARAAVRPHVTKGEAAQTALTYTMNLRLTGRL